MALFEKLGDTILNVGKDVSQKVKDVSGITKLKIDIRAKEDFINKQYMELGKACYERRQSETEEEEAIFERIDEAVSEIHKMELQILELKGTKKCPSCGAEVSDLAEYCSVCGEKISVVVSDSPYEETPSEEAEEQETT